MDTSNPLAELKDIHSPHDVSSWPLAIGWYVLIAIGIIVAVIYLMRYIHKKNKQAHFNQLNELLSAIEANYSLISDTEIIAECSVLLKRIAREKFPNENPQMLLGNEWLTFLDRTAKTQEFSAGYGKCLANTYQRQALDNKDEFFNLIRQWIRSVI